MPWLHLHVDTHGGVKACCEANIPFGNINQQSIEEIWQGESIRKFRKALLAGKRDNRCASCFKKEDSGKRSVRLETLAKFAHHLEWVAQTDEYGASADSKPIYLDIRFNNLCNLKCRTCWHGASSSWFEEAQILKQNFGKKAIVEASENSELLINQLLNQKMEIEEIYFAGGEPLMMKEHYDLLEGLIANRQTKTHLRYNTNLSILTLKDRKVLEFWEQFEQVTVSASIDGLGKQGEYIRKGLDWGNFLKNMRKIKSSSSHINLQIAPTISVFNILKLGKLHRYFVEAGLIEVNAIYLNVLSRPDHFNIKVLPKAMKIEAAQSIEMHLVWLKTQEASYDIIAEFESVIDYMNQENWEHQLSQLKTQLQLLDKMRAENYQKVFPEFKKMLDPF